MCEKKKNVYVLAPAGVRNSQKVVAGRFVGTSAGTGGAKPARLGAVFGGELKAHICRNATNANPKDP